MEWNGLLEWLERFKSPVLESAHYVEILFLLGAAGLAIFNPCLLFHLPGLDPEGGGGVIPLFDFENLGR